MKTLRTLLVIAIGIFGFTVASFGQENATFTGATADAVVLQPIGITNPTSLVFGTFAAHPTTLKTVAVDVLGSRSASTAITYEVGVIARAAIFNISGTPSATFAFTLPTGTTSLTGPGGTLTIANTDWVTDLGSYQTLTGALDGSGAKVLTVGATLQVPAARAAGVYSGTYAISVNYN